MNPFARFSTWFWTLLLAAAGIAHVAKPDFFLAYYPDYLPFPGAAVWATAWVEWLLAALIWLPRYRRMAWFSITLLMVCYLPVHLYLITDHARILHPEPAVPLWLAWVRLPLQLGLIAWAYSMYRVSAKTSGSVVVSDS